MAKSSTSRWVLTLAANKTMKNQWNRHIVAAGLLGLAALSSAHGTITGISEQASDHGLVVHISGVKLHTPKKFSAYHGTDFILQFNATGIDGGNQKISAYRHGLKYAKLVWYKSQPPVARVLLHVTEGTNPKVVKTEDGFDVLFGNTNTETTTPQEVSVTPNTTPTAQPEKTKQATKAQAIPAKASDSTPVFIPVPKGNLTITPPPVPPIESTQKQTTPVKLEATPTTKTQTPTATTGLKQTSITKISPAVDVPSQATSSTTISNITDYADEKLVSLDFVNADVSQVLRGVAIQSGLNIVMQDLGDKGAAKVNVSITHMKAVDAMNLVATMANLKVSHVDGSYIVTTAADYSKVMTELASHNTGMNTMEVIPLASGQGDTIKAAVEHWFGQVPLQVMVADQSQAAAAMGSVPATGPSPTLNKAAGPKGTPYLILIGDRSWVDKGEALIRRLDAGIVNAQDSEKNNNEAGKDDPAMVTRVELYNVKFADPRALREDLSIAVPGLDVTIPPSSVANLLAYKSGSETKDQVTQQQLAQGNSMSAMQNGGGAQGSGSSNANFGTDSGAVSGLEAPFQSMEASSVPMRIVLHGTEAQIKQAMDYLKIVDVAPKQIALELRVMSLSQEQAQKLGINWSILTGGAVNTINLNQSNGGIGSNTSPANSIAGAITGRGFNAGVTATLDAISNATNLIARPNLLAIDGREAEIFVGDDIKYVQSIQSTQNGVSVQTGDVPVGVRLAVLPHIGGQGNITLDLRPVVSFLNSFTPVPGGGELPQTSLRIAQSTVELKSGETIAIGGLIQEQDIRNVQKLPILGDLPILGNLFRQTTHDRTRTEIVFFLTVREFDKNSPADLADPKAQEKLQPLEYPIKTKSIIK